MECTVTMVAIPVTLMLYVHIGCCVNVGAVATGLDNDEN